MHFQPPAKHNANTTGFTLIEMLVVLVILSLTTSLMIQGLATTWNNFEKLGTRSLMDSSSLLPANWFVQSIEGAVLYHPDNIIVTGEPSLFSFYSTRVPNDPQNIPQAMRWFIETGQNKWYLRFDSELSSNPQTIMSFAVPSKFEYLQNSQWSSEFKPSSSKLPRAIRVITDEKVWVLAKITRPENADIPPEMATFGAYEF